jgi:hypothetical protein
MWKTVVWQTVKGIHIENLFQLLIFSVDFFLKVFIICARLKQSEGQIRFCFTLERRFGHEKNCIFIDHCIFSSRLYG